MSQAWIEPGNNPKGYKVCKYTFMVSMALGQHRTNNSRSCCLQRLPDQPPLPRRDVEEETGSGCEDRNNEDDDTTACDQDDASSKDVDAEGSEEDKK